MPHTPGPWIIDKLLSDKGAPIITAKSSWLKRSRAIAKVLYEGGSEDPEVYPNALLIAAAPEILKALKNMVREWEEIVGTEEENKTPADPLEKAKLAIAKAEGRM